MVCEKMHFDMERCTVTPSMRYGGARDDTAEQTGGAAVRNSGGAKSFLACTEVKTLVAQHKQHKLCLGEANMGRSCR